MTKRKYDKLLDIVTLLVILFPLLMLLFSTLCSAHVDSSHCAQYVQNFAISADLNARIGESINTFGIDFDGAFFDSACVIMGNALLVWLFRLFIAVMTFIPKFALKMLNISIGGDRK